MIDSHVHFWRYHPVKDAWITNDMQVIQRDFYPTDLQSLLKENEVEGCVAVQAAQSEEETHFLLQQAAQSEIIKGIVGWLDLRAANSEERLQHFSQHALIKGWRHIVQAEKKGFLLQSDFIAGIKGLKKYQYTYDILITYQQYPEAIKFVEHFNGQPFIIDHLGKPGIKENEISLFKTYVKEIAQHPDVYCKVSGMLSEADWKNWNETTIYRYMDVVFEHFGIEKLLFGSDWPVLNLAGNYQQWANLVKKYLQQFTKNEQHLVLHQNAVNFYKL